MTFPILSRKRNYSWCPQPKSPALTKALGDVRCASQHGTWTWETTSLVYSVEPWKIYSINLGLSFIIYKVGMIFVLFIPTCGCQVSIVKWYEINLKIFRKIKSKAGWFWFWFQSEKCWGAFPSTHPSFFLHSSFFFWLCEFNPSFQEKLDYLESSWVKETCLHKWMSCTWHDPFL